jgi:stalled ribosome rescue protein Dom34
MVRIAAMGIRRDDVLMTTHYHAFIWIDHQIAKVFHFDADTNEIAIVQSTHPHQHLHHKANSGDSGHAALDKDFLERVTAEVSHAGAILIAGPASAKTELHTHLKQAHPVIAAKVSAVETLDHPTDGELLAHARRFFRADDRMRSQIHSQ